MIASVERAYGWEHRSAGASRSGRTRDLTIFRTDWGFSIHAITSSGSSNRAATPCTFISCTIACDEGLAALTSPTERRRALRVEGALGHSSATHCAQSRRGSPTIDTDCGGIAATGVSGSGRQLVSDGGSSWASAVFGSDRLSAIPSCRPSATASYWRCSAPRRQTRHARRAGVRHRGARRRRTWPR